MPPGYTRISGDFNALLRYPYRRSDWVLGEVRLIPVCRTPTTRKTSATDTTRLAETSPQLTPGRVTGGILV